MKTFFEQHPDLLDIITKNNIKCYKRLNMDNTLAEQWERDKNGTFVDVTEREFLKEEIARIQEELEQLEAQDETE